MNRCFFSLIFSLLLPFLGIAEIYLKDRLVQGDAGNYLVIAQGKNTIFFHILEKSPVRITLEEITIPTTFLCDWQGKWKTWRAKGAPGHTSWLHYPITLPQGTLENFYNVDKRHWVKPGGQSAFLTTLLHLPFFSVPQTQRRKIGRSVAGGAPDTRPLWQPPLVYEGQTVKGLPFDAFFAKWPQDDSPLSEKTIEIYLPEASASYPSYFPYWLQIQGVIGQAKLRVIDSGKNL